MSRSSSQDLKPGIGDRVEKVARCGNSLASRLTAPCNKPLLPRPNLLILVFYCSCYFLLFNVIIVFKLLFLLVQLIVQIAYLSSAW